jgi:hypothetical protein
VVVSRATEIGDLGHMTSIPRKYTKSALYFRATLFPAVTLTEMSMSRLNMEQPGSRIWMLGRGQGNCAGMDGEQKIFTRGPTGSGEE